MFVELVFSPWLVLGSIYFLPQTILLSMLHDGSHIIEKNIWVVGECSEEMIDRARGILGAGGKASYQLVDLKALSDESLERLMAIGRPSVAIVSDLDCIKILEQLGIPCALVHHQ